MPEGRFVSNNAQQQDTASASDSGRFVSNEAPPTAAPEATPKPGFFKRLGQSIGIPTSEEELEAAQPSTAEKIIGPPATSARMIYGAGKQAYKGIKEGGKEIGEAAENIAEGQP